jgi:flagellar hook-associated protein 2
MGMALSGLASGFDWKSIVDQLIEVSRAPQNRMRRDQATNSQKSSALDEIRGKLASLKTSVAALNSPDSLLKKSATIADKNSNWTATATKDTPAGDYNVEMISEATPTVLYGGYNLGAEPALDKPIPSMPNDAAISSVWMGATFNAGKFTINGDAITVSNTSTFGDLLTSINNIVLASGPPTTYKYNAKLTAGNRIEIASTNGAPIEFGVDAATPTNFLQLARLYSNGSDRVASSSQTAGGSGLGRLRLDVALNSSNSNLVNGGALSGFDNTNSFTVNGVPIGVTSSTTAQEILDKISASSAGVIASYDIVTDRIVLKNKASGANAIVVQDTGGGNIAQKLGLTSAGLWGGGGNPPTLSMGQNAAFRVNGGGVIQAQSSTFTESDHGIKGLTINANSLSAPRSSFSLSATGSAYDANGDGRPPVWVNLSSIPSTLKAGMVVTGPGINPGTVIAEIQAGNGRIALSDAPSSTLINGSSLTFTTSYTPTKITVAGDTSAAKDAVNEFVAKYNDVQNTIEKHTKVTVNGTKVTSSILSGNQELNILARSLRSSLFQSAGLTGTVNRLSDLGITSMGIQNTISLSNATALESKLSSAADDLANFFKTPTTGFVARFDKLLSSVVTESGSAAGSFKARQDSISKQNSSIDKQIEDMERRLASQRAMLESSFIAMERAQSGFQQQSAYLAKTFNGK